MPVIRAQCRLPWTTALPQDVSTNTFHFFVVGDVDAPKLADMTSRLDTFYSHVGPFLTAMIDRAACTIRYYNLEDPEPRTPLLEDVLTVPNASTTISLPNEVALVLSFRALYTSGAVPARRRNRVYLGPLVETADAPVAATFNRPTQALIDAALDAGDSLGADPSTTGTRWVIYSETDAASFTVIEEWCNNEWDTQRRRGVEATQRNVVAVTQP